MTDFETREGYEKFRRTMPGACMDGNAISVSGYPDAPHISINIEDDPTIWIDVSQVDELCACLHTVKRALAKLAKDNISG